LADAVVPLKSPRFVFRTILASFLFSPLLAWLVSVAVPMERPYVVGLLLLGLAPAAPFLPLVVKNARGDLAAAAGLMLLASLGTVVVMPFGVPLVAPGKSANAWIVARPLLFLVLLPLMLGMLAKYRWPRTADWFYRYVKAITALGTILFLVLAVVLNFNGFVGSVGSHALLAQVLFVAGLAVGGYLIAAGMPPKQRSVMCLGMCTRNIGAAAAIVGTGGDQKIMVMLVIGALVTVAVSFAMAPWFARSAHSGLADTPSPETVVARAGTKN
jgi:BASS family bile acid:Na+ symporter